jgi:hypothetical protein
VTAAGAVTAPGPIDVVIEQFLRLEREHGFFERTCRGRRFWDFIRLAVSFQVCEPDSGGGATAGPSRGARLGRLATDAWRTIAAPAQWPGVDLLFIDAEAERIVGTRRINPITGPVVDAAHEQFTAVVATTARDNGRDYPCRSISLRPNLLRAQLRARATRIDARDRTTLADVAGALQAMFGIRIDVESMVARMYLYQHFLVEDLTRWLAAAPPRALLFQNDGQRWMARCAHDLGISAVELQHGATGAGDLLSSYGSDTLLPVSCDTVPDVILTFGDGWNQRFHSTATTLTMGAPFTRARADEALARRPVPSDNVLLAVSTREPEVVTAAAAFARRRPDWQVRYKLRREEYQTWRETLPPGFTSLPNVTVLAADSPSLHDHLAEATWVLSTISTVLYEALLFQAKLLVLRSPRMLFVDDLVILGLATVVDDAAGIERAVTAPAAAALGRGETFFARFDAAATRHMLGGIVAHPPGSLEN